MAKTPEKGKPKHEAKNHDKHERHEEPKAAQTATPKQRTQDVGQTGTGGTTGQAPEAIARPIPRPQFRPMPHLAKPHVSDDTQRVINSLQQTVRSQAILIVQYQTLLKLEAMETESEGEAAGEAGEAA